MRAVCWSVGVLAVAGVVSVALAGDVDPPSGAVEGTMKTLEEVEPRIAVNLENTPGDAEAIFVIDTPGSYYLIGSIKGVSGKHGIKIDSSYVTLDLMGFRMSGVSGTLDAINMPDNAGTGIEVRNGIIENWDNDGVDYRFSGHDGVVRDVRVLGCAGTGIRVGYDSLVKNCVVQGSPFGIQTSLSCRIVECDVNECSLGINAGSQSMVENCVAHDNASYGINLQGSARAIGCSSARNDSHGINGNSNSVIIDCVCEQNDGDGISVSGGVLVRGNVLSDNGRGIGVSGQYCRIESNHCADNGVGIAVTGSLNYIVRNTCANSTTNNYEIGINNRYGAILDHTMTGTPSVTGNSSSSFIGTEDPWANFAQ